MEPEEVILIIMSSNSSQNKTVLMNYLFSNNVDIDNVTEMLMFQNISHIRMAGFNNEWIQNYFALFRMNKLTFIKLWDRIDGPEFHHVYQGGGLAIPGHMQLLMTLWWLGKGKVMLSVAEKCNIAVSTVFKSTNLVLNHFLSLKNIFISWPIADKVDVVITAFRMKGGYPGVIGAIDCTNIKFKAPQDQQDSYIDKNENHSIKLQAICTANKFFTNIMVGFPGSAHDSRLFRNSNLYSEVITNGNLMKYFPLEEHHIVGDRAYPLLNWLLKPYLGDDRSLTRRHRAHNIAHSKTRIVVKHSFGLLKGRWRSLKFVNISNIQKVRKIIATCCILHNFCYLNTDFGNESQLNAENNDYIDEDGGVENFGGFLKRDTIAELF